MYLALCSCDKRADRKIKSKERKRKEKTGYGVKNGKDSTMLATRQHRPYNYVPIGPIRSRKRNKPVSLTFLFKIRGAVPTGHHLCLAYITFCPFPHIFIFIIFFF